jgi:hypothetical protein
MMLWIGISIIFNLQSKINLREISYPAMVDSYGWNVEGGWGHMVQLV